MLHNIIFAHLCGSQLGCNDVIRADPNSIERLLCFTKAESNPQLDTVSRDTVVHNWPLRLGVPELPFTLSPLFLTHSLTD